MIILFPILTIIIASINGAGQYVGGEIVFEKRHTGRVAVKVHTNSIESVWSHIKRGINRNLSSASKKHFRSVLMNNVYRLMLTSYEK